MVNHASEKAAAAALEPNHWFIWQDSDGKANVCARTGDGKLWTLPLHSWNPK
jgi:hypothetical protein